MLMRRQNKKCKVIFSKRKENHFAFFEANGWHLFKRTLRKKNNEKPLETNETVCRLDVKL